MNWWRSVRQPTVSERRAKAASEGKRRAKRGDTLSPVVLDGRTIARWFWGKAWCDNLESYRDYEYRLPRGRSYVRNGAVLDLKTTAGQVNALVSGSEVYTVEIAIQALPTAAWSRIKTQCGGKVGSLIELLEGRLSDHVMRIVTHRDEGLFPKPAEIQMSCSCPDVATMCKHVAAVMYGVGARLDEQPELLFTLRNVDPAELIAGAVELEVSRKPTRRRTIAEDALGSVFGIELESATPARSSKPDEPPRPAPAPGPKQKGRARPARTT